jgi:Xaa-Pro dipeptidase
MSGQVDLDAERRARVFAAMQDRGFDALVLGRQVDADYASGMRRLWTAGTRPMGAGCVAIAATGRVHILSSWDAGIPGSVPFEDLYPATWNPRTMSASLAAIDGLSTARRIGVDASSVAFERAAARFAPDAELVPADDLMSRVRAVKSPGEVDAIRRACALAWVGVDAVLAAGSSRSTGSEGLAIEALACAGVTIPSSVPVARPEGDDWVIDLGVIVGHYEGGVGGRFVGGERVGSSSLVDACRGGATWTDLTAGASSADWWVRGLGMGYERPVIGPDLGRDERLESGMVLSVRDGERRDVVAIVDGAPDVLSNRP